MTWAMINRGREKVGMDHPSPIENQYQLMMAWKREACALDVRSEVERAVAGLPAGVRVAVIGCGGALPAALAPGSAVIDFDEELLRQAAAGGRYDPYHSIGLRTPLVEQAVDLVVITSRLSGLFATWREELLAEAHRIPGGK